MNIPTIISEKDLIRIISSKKGSFLDECVRLHVQMLTSVDLISFQLFTQFFFIAVSSKVGLVRKLTIKRWWWRSFTTFTQLIFILFSFSISYLLYFLCRFSFLYVFLNIEGLSSLFTVIFLIYNKKENIFSCKILIFLTNNLFFTFNF
jgi:hypothetical protein